MATPARPAASLLYFASRDELPPRHVNTYERLIFCFPLDFYHAIGQRVARTAALLATAAAPYID